MRDMIYMAGGIAIGAALVFYQVDTPHADRCSIPLVSRKVVTSYVLKPPPAEIRYEACPQVTQKLDALEPSPIVQAKAEDPVVEEEKPRRHHRRHHRRYRRYW